jgi:hypothetical protein
MTEKSRGRPTVSDAVVGAVLDARIAGMSMLAIATSVGCGASTVHRILAGRMPARRGKGVECDADPLAITGRLLVETEADLRNLPIVSCVYFISSRTSGLQYVGRSKNLRSRFAPGNNWGGTTTGGHAQTDWLLAEGGFVSWIELPWRMVGLVEEALIWILNPPANSVGRSNR